MFPATDNMIARLRYAGFKRQTARTGEIDERVRAQPNVCGKHRAMPSVDSATNRMASRLRSQPTHRF